jgi:hypothetical protein
MGQSKKPRKKYRPKAGRKDTVTTLFDGDEPLKGELKEKVLMTTHLCATRLAQGNGTQQDWGAIVTAMNLSMVLCERAKNQNVGLAAVYDANNALISVQERFFEIGRRVFKGDELVAMNGGLHVFDQLVETVSKRQYVWASDQVEQRMYDGFSIAIGPGQKKTRYELRSAA